MAGSTRDTSFSGLALLGRKIWLFLGFLVAVAETLSGCHSSHVSAPVDIARLVKTAVATESDSTDVEYTGSVHARIESDLGFRVPGKITERLVDPGEFVHRGQALMRIDAANLSLSAAVADQRVRAAQADATRAKADEERLRGLVTEGAISTAVYEAALAAARATSANAEAARSAAHDADLNRQYSILVADADGVVLDVVAQPGQVVAAGTPVVRLARAGTREALIAVPETAAKTLPSEAIATLYGSDKTLPARLREVAGTADPITRTFAARYTLDIPDRDVPLGNTVSVRVRMLGEKTIRVPLGSLYDPGSGPGVWVIDAEQRVAFRAVSVRRLGEESIDLAPGAVRAGDVVVALGAALLRAGQQVRIERNPS